MKKLLLATAVAALSVSAAHAAPTVYGKAFLTADYNDLTTDVTHPYDVTVDTNGNVTDSNVYKSTSVDSSNSALNSTGSRIGLKGAEALTANTDLVYQLEYGIEVDDSNGGTEKGKSQDQFYARDTYLGLSNKQYGTALAGRLTTIDDMINYANVTAGGVLGGDDVLASVTAPRVNNAFAYVSPSYNGLNFLGMYALDSDQDATTDDLAALGLDNYDKWGVGFKYEPTNQPYRFGATYIGIGSDLVKDIRVSGAYDVTPAFTLGGLYQLTDIDGADKKENAYTLSASYKTATPWTVYGQADVVNNVLGTKDADKERFVLGGKYAFNPATTGHIYGAYINAENKNVLVDSVDNADGTTTYYGADKIKTDGFGIGAGIEYKF